MPIVLTIIVVAQLLFGIDSTVVTVALPSIGVDLGLDVVGQSWIQTAYVVAFGGLLLLGGRLGDAFGRRRTLVAGVVLFTAASLAGGLAPAGGWLIACRALQGAGAALAGPNTMALLMLTFAPGAARNRALAIYSSVLGVGGVLGLVLGGVLTSLASWRWGLLVNLPIGLAIAVAAPRDLPETGRRGGQLDLPGIGASIVGLATLVFGLTMAAEHGWGAPTAVLPLAVAVVVLAGFVAIERRSARPVLPLELLLDRTRGAGYLASLMASAAMFGLFFLLTQYLQEVLRFDALLAGLAFLALMGPTLVMVRAVPRLLAGTAPTTLVVAGAVLMIAAAAWLSRLDAMSSYAGGLLGPMLVLGVGAGITFVPLSSSILAAVPPQHAGAAAGALQVSQYTGTALGVAVLVGVFAHTRAGGADLAHALSTAMLGAGAFATAVAALALIARAARQPPITPPITPPGTAPTSDRTALSDNLDG